MTKIAYFISAYKEPESIIRLINILNRESDYFYIHFDKAKSSNFGTWKKQIESESRSKNIKVVSEFDCKWASFGIVDATLSAIKSYENVDYDYMINLTGECYPLKSTSQLSEMLTGKKVNFLTYWKLPHEGWFQGGMNRLYNRFYYIPKRDYPYVRIFRIPRLIKKLPGNLQPYGGWSLFCLSKDLVNYVVKYTEKNPSFKSFFKRAHAPSEMYFQTILLNSPFANRIINDNKRFTVFVEAHPRTITINDFEMLKRSDYMFGRKFNPRVDKKVLDLIDSEIMGLKAGQVQQAT